MVEEHVRRKLAAILAADVVGYGRLMGGDEAGTRVRFNELLNDVITPAINENRGRLVKTMGDGFLVEFGSVVDAVQCAVNIQNEVSVRQAAEPDNSKLQFRIGIHLGDVILEGDDIHGDGVNIAARLETLAEPNGICLSDMVYAGIRNKLSLRFKDLGEKSLKNIADPQRVYRIVLEKTTQEAASLDSPIFFRPAIAVLPFENLSGDPEQEYFADGLTEDIITTLSLWRSFPVIARNSTFAYKGQSPDIREVGKQLGARYVIEGSVRKAGNRVRVTAQLINAETGHHVWAERYDRDLDDVFELQDLLTQQIVATVTPELVRTEHSMAVSRQPKNMEAWDYCLRGWAHYWELRPEANGAARNMFTKAIELDPSYSSAHTGFVCTCIREMPFKFGRDREALCSKAIEMGQRAIELDPSDSKAHQFLGIALGWAGQHDQGIAEEEKAISLNPSNDGAYASMGHQLTLSGRPEEGIPYLEKGLRLSPHNWAGPLFQSFMARAHLTARQYEEAADWARRAVRARSDLPEAQLLLAASLGHLDEVEKARAAMAEYERLRPGFATGNDSWMPFKFEKDLDNFLDGLRKAGWEG